MKAVIKVGDVELTPEQAREVYAALREVFEAPILFWNAGKQYTGITGGGAK